MNPEKVHVAGYSSLEAGARYATTEEILVNVTPQETRVAVIEHGVTHELIVIPDDVHESMLHSRWIETWERMGSFLRKHVWQKAPTANAAGR